MAGTDLVLHEGDVISIDGAARARSCSGAWPSSAPHHGDLATVLGWADDVRRLGVRANADNPADARLSLELGAEGIGLTRTEHMFLGARKSIIQRFILADTSDERASAAEELSRAPGGRLL